ncbi:hypothetical protein GBA63_19090 [Rubrobacter tropicus]|uniref:Uncharacterized protein n=1 Tax=Rubrobacter tropicus TaxID=2653851 RepID=A0A6G8QDC9_9ACTN|nr:hypothetical protein [Rubrobacter tropicus]QIN84514.1 hypothetical protein GBA63_19090 [Rubrobacter tropicus]
MTANKTDEWIADALGTSPSSVQSFRSRNGIHRSGPGEPESVFEGNLDHGERDGWGLWLDPAILEDPIWLEHWAGVESVTVKVAEDSVVLEAVGDVPGSAGQQPRAIAGSSGGEPVRAPDPESAPEPERQSEEGCGEG